MTNEEDKINQLLGKLDILLKRQESFSREIGDIREELYRLQSLGDKRKTTIVDTTVVTNPKTETNQETSSANLSKDVPGTVHRPQVKKARKAPLIDLEKFIGENLINKIGIIITVIGVSIGAKYSIENDLISPLTRIILGYLTGIGLLVVGIKLKQKYESYSAVLVSGAMAIMYFMTYAAYSFYGLLPQTLTFGLMVVFTAFTAATAIHYNRQVIAIIGLVGAYAVPFLLSDGSGKAEVLFSYMAIVNTGILAVAIKKYWKLLYYISFGLTWLIFFGWTVTEYSDEVHFSLAFSFLTIFFFIFYTAFLSYKLLQKEKFERRDIVLLLSNSFIFYGIGFGLLSDNPLGSQLLGVFTLVCAIIHFAVGMFIYRQKAVDKNLFYLVIGLVLVFITVAVPVQLDGNWVTLLWAGEAALLFWIGRTRNIPIYEKLSYPLMVLAFFSIIQDWDYMYGGYIPEKPETKITPLFNVNFLSSALFLVAFGIINVLNRNPAYSSPTIAQKRISSIVAYAIPGIWLFTLYFVLRIEIENYFDQLYTDSAMGLDTGNYDLLKFQDLWTINYSLLYFTVLSFVNIHKLKVKALAIVNLAINGLSMLAFLVGGLYILSELRDSYLNHENSSTIFNIIVRYISHGFAIALLVACYQYVRQDFVKWDLKKPFGYVLHVCILWITSSELINWMEIAASTQSYKLGLSILWGVYALFLIILGIWKKKTHLRVGAIALFAVTLVKLFFYDISHLNTISKTIVFVSLGVLLLIISFLYNKYKHIIADETKD